MSAPDPRDVLREAVEGVSFGFPRHHAALSAVDALVEAARRVDKYHAFLPDAEAALALTIALARFAGDRNPPA